MTPVSRDPHRSAGDIFADAIDLPASERSQFLDRACGDDRALRNEVDSLLAAHQSAGEFMNAPAIDTDLPMAGIEPEDLSGTHAGAYRLVKILGTGGMSTVYLGERADAEFEKQVAVKLIKRGMDTDHILSRFRNERQVLAGLEHQNIARLLDGGVTADGRPYLIMEYIDGIPVDQFCGRNELAIGDRLRLFRTVCTAVQYAHRNLVVHRDLKPSNILVTRSGKVKLLDFGISKVLQPESAEALGMTATGFRLMTPRYASPEQVRGEPVTTATDVYSLGVILYELLTGQPPYRIKTTVPTEVERVIGQTEPPRPSTVISQGTTVPGRNLARRLAGDIDNIVLKALRKEPDRRYESADQFSEDVRRHLDGLPVMARPDTVGYRTAKFVQRNRVPVAATGIVFLSLVAATILSTSLYFRSERALAEAEVQRTTAGRVSGFLEEMMVAVDPVEMQSGEAVTVERILQEASKRIDDELGEEPAVAAALHHTMARTFRNLGAFDEAKKHGLAELALQDELYGPRSIEAAGGMLMMGGIFLEQGENERAESLFQEVRNISESTGNGEDEITANTYRALGKTRSAQGDYEEAKKLCRRAIEIRRALPGDHREELAGDLNQLGLSLVQSGKHEESVAALREALDLMTATRGKNHTFIGQINNNIGWALGKRGDWSEAAGYLREAIVRQENIFAPDHPNVLVAHGNLAQALFNAGQLEEAEIIYEEVIVGFRSRFGDRHANVGHALNNYATMLENGKEVFADAADLYRQALSIYREQLGNEHPYCAIANHNLARTLHKAGRLSDAEKECRSALAVRRAVLRDGHPDIARDLDLMGTILMDQGDPAAARGFYEEAVAILRNELPEGNERIVDTEARLAFCLAKIGH